MRYTVLALQTTCYVLWLKWWLQYYTILNYLNLCRDEMELYEYIILLKEQKHKHGLLTVYTINTV